MFKLNQIGEFFNRLVHQRGLRAVPFDILGAMKDRNISAVRSGLESIQDEMHAEYRKKHREILIEEALRTHDVDIFKCVFEMYPDPNQNIHIPSSVDGHGQQRLLIEMAMYKGAEEIGVFIAKHKDFKLAERGSRTTMNGHGRVFITDFPSPICLTEKKGMNELSDVLNNLDQPREPKSTLANHVMKSY